MYDSESSSSVGTNHSDSDLSKLTSSKVTDNSNRQPLPPQLCAGQSTTFRDSANSPGRFGISDSPRSAHQPSNQGCHVSPEEAGPFKGGKVLETPNLTPRNQYPLRHTPPSFLTQHPTPHRYGWAMGRGGGSRTRVEEAKTSTL